MHKSKCPVCGSTNTVHNGFSPNGTQRYKCNECGYRFRNIRLPSNDEIWQLYQDNKQTVAELAAMFSTSESTIKRRIHDVEREWKQPPLCGCGYVHLDATYWGHNWGLMLGLDDETGYPLYVSFIKNETTADYIEAVRSIESRGYLIKGIIIDGKQTLFSVFYDYKIQMCQFHMKEIIRRKLTKNPRLKSARALKRLMETLTTATKADFVTAYQEWKVEWKDTLNRRSVLRSGKTQYTHKRLRSAMHSIDTYLPYLFTYQECGGMPNTNNKIEGTFTDLKKNLNNHSGMSRENRKRFISGFFLALKNNLSTKKQDPR